MHPHDLIAPVPPRSDDAFDIASRFFDSGQKRNELELAILRHMEHHIALAREACAKALMAATAEYEEGAYVRAFLRQEMTEAKNL